MLRDHVLRTCGDARARLQGCPYLCTSLAALPMDRHSSTMAVTMASGTSTRGLRAVCVICLYGGIRALAAFHE
jgi:hypothetical protein